MFSAPPPLSEAAHDGRKREGERELSSFLPHSSCATEAKRARWVAPDVPSASSNSNAPFACDLKVSTGAVMVDSQLSDCTQRSSQASQHLGCSQLARNLTEGASELRWIRHAIMVKTGAIAWLTMLKRRRVESFPWQLPAGWYAFHVASGELGESLRSRVANEQIP